MLRRVDGTFDQVSAYAPNLADAEAVIHRDYVLGAKNPPDPWGLVGSTIERITFDEYAHLLPAHDYVDED